MKQNKSILVFGGGDLQISIIEECKKYNLQTVVIDPNPNAIASKIADIFEVVPGNNFEKTCEVVENNNISAIITSATDKPLIMMAKIAEKFHFPFFPIDTAILSTDKFLMKQKFIENKIPCANGFLIEKNSLLEITLPVIIKPRDNSGSRGVIYCSTKQELANTIEESFKYTKLNTILCEEVIQGKEYSIETIHYKGNNKILQITEKITTNFPYNVEIGHIQPSELTDYQISEIDKIINKISSAFKFTNCASHTEIKINEQGIFVIETSPRLGGDFITSKLVPLSTGINMEKALIDIALNYIPVYNESFFKSSAIFYFNFEDKNIVNFDFLKKIKEVEGVKEVRLDLKTGEKGNKITNSLERYGYVVLQKNNRKELLKLKEYLFSLIK